MQKLGNALIFPALLLVSTILIVVGADEKDAAATAFVSKAVDMVKGAKPEERGSVAVTVVKVVNDTKPELLIRFVGDLSKAIPELSATVAGRSAFLQSTNAPAIAGAAGRAAPAYADQVMRTVCTNSVSQWAEITIELALAAPAQSHSIVYELSDAIDVIYDYLERAKTTVLSGRNDLASVELLVFETIEIIEAEGKGKASDVIARLYEAEQNEE